MRAVMTLVLTTVAVLAIMLVITWTVPTTAKPCWAQWLATAYRHAVFL